MDGEAVPIVISSIPLIANYETVRIIDKELTLTVLERMAASLRRLPLKVGELADGLGKLNLPETAATVRELIRP